MRRNKGVIKKTCKVAKNVIKKTQELFELSQINMKIIGYKNKIERKFVKIGYCIYKKQEKSGLSSLREEIGGDRFKIICDDIKKLYNKIYELEKEREEIKRYDEKDRDEDEDEDFSENVVKKQNHKFSIEMENDFENEFADWVIIKEYLISNLLVFV